MKILKKYRCEIEDSWRGSEGYVKQIPFYRGRLKKPVSVIHLTSKTWRNLRKATNKSEPCFLTGPKIVEGTQKYYYFYDDLVYESEVHLEPEDVKLIIESEQEKREETILRELKRVKAKAETEGRVRKAISNEVQVMVWNRDNGKCVQCGRNKNLEFDHIIPISQGGSNTARNLQLLCEKCNRSKGSKIGG